MIALAIIYLVLLLITLIKVWSAPEGYEDESGFHYGREDDHNE